MEMISENICGAITHDLRNSVCHRKAHSYFLKKCLCRVNFLINWNTVWISESVEWKATN